ncbi:MAG TPA: hypothetical protein VHK69_11980, partial [Chitinophagaceae bacterium]|nr:hypothetical protein [Chitinophagaceae bacterium]
MKKFMPLCGWIVLLFFALVSCRARQRADGALAAADTARLQLPSHPLRALSDLDTLIRAIGDARVVLLGEASHGTAEYYNWRAALSQRLIREKGFRFIAVEGEWADSYRVNNFI